MDMIRRWFTQTGALSRLVAGSNDTESYRVLYPAIPCLIQETTGSRTTAAAMGIYRAHSMFCSLGTDIKDDDHVVEGGRTFIVKGTVAREQGITVKHLEVLLELSEG